MTFAVLRALHAIIGEALDDIEAVYMLHGMQDKPSSGLSVGRDQAPTPDSPGQYSLYSGQSRPNHRPTVSVNSISNVYASPPPSPCIKTENSSESLSAYVLDFPSLDAPCNPTSLSEALTQHPEVISAVNRIIAACGQMTATIQTPFLTICDAVMGYHLPSCMRLFEASHTPEILREAGPTGLHVNAISEKSGVDKAKLAHILRLLATHHIVRELSPDVFTLNRISSTIDTGKKVNELHQWTMEGIPERKYETTSGIAAFVGLCSDEIFKSSAYLTETYLLAQSNITRAGSEPTRAPFCFAFDTVESKTGFFGWLEGSAESQPPSIELTNDVRAETGRGALYTSVKGGNVISNSLKAPGPALARENLNANRFRLERFGKAMSGTCSWEAPGAILNSFEWHTLSRGSVIVDVGGGIGSTSMLLASAFSSSNDSPDLRFIIQDRPVVVEMGEKAWKVKCPEFLQNGTAVFQVHDFFARQPVRQAAVFLLRVVLHDWPDDFARRILLHLREAATPTTKLLLGDFILPLACLDEAGGNEMLQDVQGVEAMLAPPPLLPNLGKASANAYWMDLTMQVMFNAQERTLREIVALAASAGWKVTRVTKCSSSLFGYILAIPSVVPPQTQYPTTSAISYRDPAFAIPKSSAESTDVVSPGIHDSQSYHRHNERELIERSSSRCGTPTFGSRMQLSLVEEALSRFGGGIFRSRKLGTATRTGVSSKTPSLKQAITLTPAPPAKKKPSPLSVPSLEKFPPPASPTTKALSSPKRSSSRLSQKIIPRRLSLANLRAPSTSSHEHPPLPNVRTPPSPMSPPQPLSRKSSLAQLSTPTNQQDPHPLTTGLAGPAPISTRQIHDPSPSTAPKSRKLSTGQVSLIPTLLSPSASAMRCRESEDHQTYFQLQGWNASGKANQQPQNPAMARRSSSAQLQIPSSPHEVTYPTSLQAPDKIEQRKRTKSVASLSSRAGQHATNAVAFMSEIGASFTNGLEGRVGTGSSRLGGLLSRGGGGTNLRFEKGRDVAMPGRLPDSSSLVDINLDAHVWKNDQDREEQGNSDSGNGSTNVLAAAARIEKKVLRRRESP